MAYGLASILQLLALLLPLRAAAADYTIADSAAGPLFDGIGASFSGAAARLLRDYDDGNRSAILDLLFAPSGAPSTADSFKGAALQILRLEIGGDANTGLGSEPAYLHGAADAPNVRRGWAGWLAQEALARNPAIKVFVSPSAWPAFLGGAPSDPFLAADAVAAYVANYVALLRSELGVAVEYVGLWRSPAADVARLASMKAYALSLRAQLDAAALGDVRIVCADSSATPAAAAWSCANATDPADPLYDAQLAQVVGVLGNAGRPASDWPPGAGGGALPVWMTGFTLNVAGPQPLIELGAMGMANEWAEAFVTSSVPRLGGFVYEFGLTSSPYGFPRWRTGLISASHPWSSSWSASVALYAIGHVNQFVPAGRDWRILPVGAGSGQLAQGGTYVSFYSPSTSQWSLVIQKFCCTLCGCAATSVQDELATFTLAGALAGVFSTAAVYRSSYPVYGFFGSSDQNRSWAIFERDPALSLAGNTFTLQLSPGDLVTISTAGASVSPFKGCASSDCESDPPPPTAQGAGLISFAAADGVPTFAPGRFMSDINGAFEIVADPSSPGATVLAQASDGRPLGPYSGARPHTLTGDLDTTDADVAAEALLAQTDGAAALLGAHIFTFHSATPATLDAAPGVWLRVARASAQSLAWALLAGLDDNSYGAPVATGTVQLGAPLGAASWLTLRLIVRGSGTAMRAAGSVAVGGSGATLLFNRPIPWAPQAGFFGLATGSFTPSEAVFRSLDVRAAATTCDAVPAEGAFVEVEMCQVGAPGQMFELWLPRTTVAADFSYKALVNYDAPDLDCGPKLAGAPDTWAAQCADNLTAALNGTAPPGATCACVAYNSNGYPKAAYSDLEVYAYGSVTLNVMQPPRGQLRLTANTSLCLSFGGGDDNNGALILARCDDDADSRLINASQLFAFSREAVDNSLAVSGPLLAVDARGPGLVPNGAPCVDVWDLSFDVDHAVRQGGWNKNVLRFSLSTATSNPLTLAPPHLASIALKFNRLHHRGSNQVFSFPWGWRSPGLVRATHMDTCLGACAAL